jgi:hypothetical protein
MQLSVAFVAISQAHATNSLQLSPLSPAVLFPQLRKIVNPPTDGDYLKRSQFYRLAQTSSSETSQHLDGLIYPTP